jgi:hypothetical protein
MLVFRGFSTYHPKFSQRFLKDGRPVEAYAFPIKALGTIILMIGMLICLTVVEQSTEKAEYLLSKPGDETGEQPRLRLFWLQRADTVSDQTFDSFVMFGKISFPSRPNFDISEAKQKTNNLLCNHF